MSRVSFFAELFPFPFINDYFPFLHGALADRRLLAASTIRRLLIPCLLISLPLLWPVDPNRGAFRHIVFLVLFSFPKQNDTAGSSTWRCLLINAIWRLNYNSVLGEGCLGLLYFQLPNNCFAELSSLVMHLYLIIVHHYCIMMHHHCIILDIT